MEKTKTNYLGAMFGLKKWEERKRVEWREREKKGEEGSSEIRFHCLV